MNSSGHGALWTLRRNIKAGTHRHSPNLLLWALFLIIDFFFLITIFFEVVGLYMDNYPGLEARLEEFLKEFETYENLYNRIINHPHRPTRDPVLVQEEKELRRKLGRDYGELASDIHGMAGYTSMLIAGQQVPLFETALDPRLGKENFLKDLCLDYSIQCINKAIGSCKHASKVSENDTQIIIPKGARIEGILALRKIFLSAKKGILLQDRNIDADIFNFIEDIGNKISWKIILDPSTNHCKLVKKCYALYSQTDVNVEIVGVDKSNFHSRMIIIDESSEYGLDFSIRGVGDNQGIIEKIRGENIAKIKREFSNNWKLGQALR